MASPAGYLLSGVFNQDGVRSRSGETTMSARLFIAGFLLLLGFTAGSFANPTWMKGFPATSDVLGAVDVQGTFTVPDGFSTQGDYVIAAIPDGGGTKVETKLQLPRGLKGKFPWKGTLPGLTSGRKYKVFVGIHITDGTVEEVYRTDPEPAVAR